MQTVAAAAAAPTFTPPPDTTGQPQLNIVFVSAEVGPWSKTGGLGDVTGALLCALLIDAHV